ncbi:MAG: putative toxin-antitoxin system toxin component, PIN family [Thermomicrobiales bacterium]
MSTSSAPPRVVVDTNLFVSGLILRRGNPFRLVEAFRAHRFHLILSDAQYTEIVGVFGRPKIVVKYRVLAKDIDALLTALAAAPRVIPRSTLPVRVRDPKDEKILGTALAGDADYLVTGDEDLTTLAGDPHPGTLKIVTVVEFLAVLDELDEEAGEAGAGTADPEDEGWFRCT